MTFIPDDKIDAIRERADIVQIVSEYVSLKKAGKNHKGLCPFHPEKTPSFTVSEDKQIFYCFGCHTGGNVITFLMRHENMSFPETVQHLAKRYGIEINEVRSQESGVRSQKEQMFSMNQAASEFFIKNLQTDSKGAQNARDYLKKRGLTNDIIKEFKIGYAPDSWDGVLNFLKYKKSPLDIAEKVGLIIKKNDRYYDRFRNRLMFPILDVQARIIGFGARTLGNDDAKYINSPESEIFKKGEVFYGIHQAKAYVSKAGYTLVVEGYFDLIALHQYGFKNSIATMGTALTENHLVKLRNYAGEVYALFDGDEAGRRAALRSVPLFLDEDTKARVVLIPHGIDPDDLLRKQGRESLERCIKEAQSFMDFLIDETKKRFDTTSSRGKIAFIEDVGRYISKIKNNVEKNFYTEKTAHLMQVGRDVVVSAIKQNTISKPQTARIKPSGKEVALSRVSGARLAEETILKILVFYPNFYSERIREVIEAFKDSTLKDAGRFLAAKHDSNMDEKLCIADLLDKMPDENVKQWFIKTSISDIEDIKENPEKILDDCCKKVISYNIDREEVKGLLKQFQEADKTGDRKLLETAAKQFTEKKKKLL